MNDTRRVYAWAVVVADAIFMLMSGGCIAYDYIHSVRWDTVQLNIIMFGLWTYWLIQDTKKLRQRHLMYMSDQAFDNLKDWLLDNKCDWKKVGISNTYINNFLVPAAGLYLVDWTSRQFAIVDKKRYVEFSLRYL